MVEIQAQTSKQKRQQQKPPTVINVAPSSSFLLVFPNTLNFVLSFFFDPSLFIDTLRFGFPPTIFRYP